jgi:CDGSH-type Zn-finger protein
MARLVRLEGIGPVKIDPATLPLGPDGKPKKIAVCVCGLSSKFPICDGTHKQLNEQPGQVYCYDPALRALLEAPGSVVMREPLLPPPPATPPTVVPPPPLPLTPPTTPPIAPSDVSR